MYITSLTFCRALYIYLYVSEIRYIMYNVAKQIHTYYDECNAQLIK